MVNDLVVREVADRDEWDALVLDLSTDGFRQSFEWGELKASHGWIPRRLAVFDNAACLAATSVLVKRLPLVNASILYASGGPLIADIGHAAAWQSLFAGISVVAAQTGAILLRVDPKTPDEDQTLRRTLVAHGFRHLSDDWTEWNNPRIVMTLDVTAPEADLKRRLHKRVAQYLKRLAKGGGQVTPATSADAMMRFHRLLIELGERKQLPVRGLEYFEELRRRYVNTGQGCLLMANSHGADLAGLLATRFGKWAYLLYACVDTNSEQARSLHPGPSLYWELIRWARANGCEMIELGGSGTNYPPRETDPGFGVYRFKEAFGASLVYLTGYYDYVFRPALYRSLRLSERILLPLGSRLHATFRGRFSPRSVRPADPVSVTKDAPDSLPDRRGLKILFLGNSHNELSLSCLLGLTGLGHEIIVGGYETTAEGLWSTLREVARSRGLAFVLRKGLQRVRSRLLLFLRRLGVSARRFTSRSEVVIVHKLRTEPCGNPNNPEFVARVRELDVDLIVVAGFNRILKSDLIKTPRLGCINVHPSLLPKYRGPNPYYWVLANHETVTGVTIHQIDVGIDSGNIIAQRELAISPDETEATLMTRAAAVAAALLKETIPLIAAGTAPSTAQDESKATYYSHPPRGSARGRAERK